MSLSLRAKATWGWHVGWDCSRHLPASFHVFTKKVFFWNFQGRKYSRFWSKWKLKTFLRKNNEVGRSEVRSPSKLSWVFSFTFQASSNCLFNKTSPKSDTTLKRPKNKKYGIKYLRIFPFSIFFKRHQKNASLKWRDFLFHLPLFSLWIIDGSVSFGWRDLQF